MVQPHGLDAAASVMFSAGTCEGLRGMGAVNSASLLGGLLHPYKSSSLVRVSALEEDVEEDEDDEDDGFCSIASFSSSSSS